MMEEMSEKITTGGSKTNNYTIFPVPGGPDHGVFAMVRDIGNFINGPIEGPELDDLDMASIAIPVRLVD